MTKILIIAPHPDDEVLGCGGTILKHVKSGDEVYLCIVTKAYTPDWSEEFLKERPKEIEESNRILGIKKTYFLDFPDAKLDTIPQKELQTAISKVVKEVNPEVVFLPHRGDAHKDHRLVFEAGLFICRPGFNSSVKKILSYEALSETEWGKDIQEFIPHVYEDITNEIQTKIEAMRAHKSELREYPHPRSLEIVEILAKKRGSEARLKFAESFMMIREIK